MTQNQPSQKKESLLVAIGGGKGGVGKSMVSSNLAIQYANAGFKVIIIDLDIGAANVHTIFGLRNTPKGLGEYFTTPRSQLSDYLVQTDVPNVQLIAGGGFVPVLANLKHMQKIKLINHIKGLEADLVLLDLGAGTSTHVIDFFSMTHAGIVVTTPEPTAVTNAYEFLKNVVYRVLFRMFRQQKEILSILNKTAVPDAEDSLDTIGEIVAKVEEINPWAAETIKDVCRDFDFYLILNQARKPSQAQLGLKLRSICQRFLCMNLTFSGMLYYNEEVSASVFKMCPLSVATPNSVTSLCMKRIAINTFTMMANRMLNSKDAVDPELALEDLIRHSKKDFKLNLLTQKRLQRDRERREPVY